MLKDIVNVLIITIVAVTFFGLGIYYGWGLSEAAIGGNPLSIRESILRQCQKSETCVANVTVKVTQNKNDSYILDWEN